MLRFDNRLVKRLAPYVGVKVESVAVGYHMFQIAFRARITCFARAAFRIRGVEYQWAGRSTDAPIGLFVGQDIVEFWLSSAECLSMRFVEGDELDFFITLDSIESIKIDHFNERRSFEVY